MRTSQLTDALSPGGRVLPALIFGLLAALSGPGSPLLPAARAAVGIDELPVNAFVIEAEQFDYDGGQSKAAVDSMPLTGAEYAGLSAVHNIDYHRTGPNGNGDLYRAGEDPNVPVTESLGVQLGKTRPGFEVTTNYRLGWITDGEWYNYSRAVPAGYYKVYAAFSHEGTAAGQLRGRLGLVTAGAGTPTQTVQDLGEFNDPGSGAWGRNNLVPLRDTDGVEPVIALPGGRSTLRFSTTSGDFDWFVLAPTAAPVFQPDLAIARADDWHPAGTGVYNTTGAGQTRSQEVVATGRATYRAQLDHRLPGRGTIRLNASSTGSGWNTVFRAGQTSLRFDGLDDVVAIGNWTPGPQWALEARVKPATIPAGRRTIVGGFADCLDWGLSLEEGQFGVATKPPGACTVTLRSGVAAVPGRWYHLAATCDGAVARFFLDGQEVASGPVEPNYVGTGGGVRIGGEVCCTGNNFPGHISQVRIWNRALSPEELATHRQQPPAADAPGLAGWWKLDEGLGTSVADASPAGHAGTLVNGPIWDRALDSDPANNLDITALITGEGWQTPVLLPRQSVEIQVEVTAGPAVAEGEVQETALTATALDPGERQDRVIARTILAGAGTVAEGRTYTTTADFGIGRLFGVEASSTPDQLQLRADSSAFPFLWVPNSNEGTISKVDVRTGRELGRYRTSPRGDANPSRTTVDLWGNCWVGNRQTATAVKVGLLENGQYSDRNGNGVVETSWDRNADGEITGDELRPWGQDECVLFEILLVPGKEATYVPGTPDVPYANDYWNPGPRGLAVDSLDNAWVGTYATRRFYYIDGATGQILKNLDVSSANHTSYGAVISADGILWSAGQDKQHVLRLDPRTDQFQAISVGQYVYGINVDRANHLYISGWQDSKLARLNTATGVLEWTVPGVYQSRGVAITDDGDVWTADSGPGTVTRWSSGGVIRRALPVGSQPTGVAVDAYGKVWAVNVGDEYIKRIDPAYNQVELHKRIPGTTHYGYSDMTGIAVRNSTTRLGFWTVTHNGRIPNAPWGTVSWQGFEPPGTSIKVRIRSSNDQQTWSLWQPALNGVPLRATLLGRYLQIEAALQTHAGDVSPALHEITVQPAQQVDLGTLVYEADFAAGPGPEWSVARTDVTPLPRPAGAASGQPFLGQFGNTDLTLTLDQLPTHVAATVVADLFVIRSWDGNSTAEGPDLFEINVAGGLRLVHSTFNNGPVTSAASGQAHPDDHPAGSHPARTDALENNTLGYTYAGAPMDSVYRLVRTLPHTASRLQLNFAASGLDPDLDQESWGLGEVKVYVTPLAVPLALVPGGFMPGGQFTFELLGEAQRTYAVQASTDLAEWKEIGTVTLTSSRAEITDPDSTGFPYRYYRVELKR